MLLLVLQRGRQLELQWKMLLLELLLQRGRQLELQWKILLLLFHRFVGISTLLW